MIKTKVNMSVLCCVALLIMFWGSCVLSCDINTHHTHYKYGIVLSLDKYDVFSGDTINYQIEINDKDLRVQTWLEICQIGIYHRRADKLVFLNCDGTLNGTYTNKNTVEFPRVVKKYTKPIYDSFLADRCGYYICRVRGELYDEDQNEINIEISSNPVLLTVRPNILESGVPQLNEKNCFYSGSGEIINGLELGIMDQHENQEDLYTQKKASKSYYPTAEILRDNQTLKLKTKPVVKDSESYTYIDLSLKNNMLTVDEKLIYRTELHKRGHPVRITKQRWRVEQIGFFHREIGKMVYAPFENETALEEKQIEAKSFPDGMPYMHESDSEYVSYGVLNPVRPGYYLLTMECEVEGVAEKHVKSNTVFLEVQPRRNLLERVIIDERSSVYPGLAGQKKAEERYDKYLTGPDHPSKWPKEKVKVKDASES